MIDAIEHKAEGKMRDEALRQRTEQVERMHQYLAAMSRPLPTAEETAELPDEEVASLAAMARKCGALSAADELIGGEEYDEARHKSMPRRSEERQRQSAWLVAALQKRQREFSGRQSEFPLEDVLEDVAQRVIEAKTKVIFWKLTKKHARKIAAFTIFCMAVLAVLAVAMAMGVRLLLRVEAALDAGGMASVGAQCQPQAAPTTR